MFGLVAPLSCELLSWLERVRQTERERERKWRSGLDVMWCFLTVWYLGLKAWWHYCINHGTERKNSKAQHGHPILSTSVNRFTLSPVSVSVFVPVYMLNNKHVCARRWRNMVHITRSALCNVCHHAGSQLALDNFHSMGEGGGVAPMTMKTKDAIWSISAPDANLCRCFYCKNVYKSVFNVHETFQRLFNDFLSPLHTRHA